MAEPVPMFPGGTAETVAKIIGDLYSGSELTRLCAEVPLRDDPGEGQTKWRRLAHALSAQQQRQRDGRPVLRLVSVAMAPQRTVDRIPAAAQARDELNQALSLVGFKVLDDGKIARAALARSDVEAKSRSERLRVLLAQRGAHPQVLEYVRPELMRGDYYEAVFEAIKGLGSRLRDMGSRDADGPRLVEGVLESRDGTPIIRLNDLRTQSQRDEQRGVALLMKGLFAAFRNPAAHEPRIEWTMSEHDALDVLGTLSMLHRRLDSAR